MVSIFLALTFGRALLFHYCTHEGRSQHSVADTGALLNFGDKLSLEDLPTQCKHTKCKGLFFFKGTFFCWGPSGRRPKVRKNASKVRKYPSNLDPSKPTGLKKNAPFFSRPSVHPLKLFQQLAPQDQGEWMCSKPVYIPHKFRNVQMFALAAHSKKQAKVLYFDTNCGSKVVQPKSSGYAPGSEWCVRVPDPILIQHQTGQAQNAHMI